MKLTQKIGIFAATCLVTFVGMTNKSYAVSIVNMAIDLVSPPFAEGEPVFTMCEEQDNCAPGDTSEFVTGTGTAVNINNNLNDTQFTFTTITYEILDDDASWGTVTSIGFDVTVEGKVAVFEGLLLPGDGFRVDRTVEGDPVNLSLTVDGVEAIPEPGTILGSLAFGGFSLWKSKKKMEK